MRIDFIVTELNVGGAERCLTELATNLQASGDEIRVFSIGSLPNEGSTGQTQAALVHRLRDHKIEVHSGEATSVWNTRAAYQRMSHFLRSSPPHLCQTFLHHANVLGTLAVKRHTEAISVGGLRVAENRRLRCLLEARAVASMDALVCVSEGVGEFAKRHLACPAEKRYVIPNGVDCVRFGTPCANPNPWENLQWPADAEVILFVGRMHPQKGIDLLQAQIDQLLPFDSNRRLLLIGEGPLEDAIDAWCEQIGGHRAKRLGFQSDIRPWMQASRMLVLPSRYEGMPNVVLEAMASSLPVVVANVEGVRELLPHPDRQIFEVGNDQAMRSLIDVLLTDENLRTELGDENRERVARDFSIPAMVDAYRRLYRKLLQT